MNQISFFEYGKNGKTQFAFSTHRINPLTVYPAQIRNASNAVTDIGFDSSGIIDTSAITSFASGNNARISKLYDQKGKNGYLSIENSTGGTEFLCTDASFNGLNYARDISQTMGLFKIGNFPMRMNKDFIVNYVFRNETQGNSQRLNFMIKTDLAGHEGIISICILVGVGIAIKYIYTNRNIQMSDITYTFPKGNSGTNFTLLTFSYIQGIFTFYRNGVAVTTTTTNFNVGGLSISGIFIGTGYSDMLNFKGNVNASGGKINDFKTLSLLTGANLSSFDVSAYINQYKTIHSIL